jgi:N-acetylneuraminic acid mutarotase
MTRIDTRTSKKTGMVASALTMLTLFILTAGAALPLQAQSESADKQAPAVIIHNTWKSGAPLPTPVASPAAAVLLSQIYVIGGGNGTEAVAGVQIYNPVTNAWSTGVSYPTAISAASAAVVKNVLYVFGGTIDGSTPTNAVWAYNPKTKTWTAKAALPTARYYAAAVVESNIIYVMGGAVTSSDFVATVESYNPATNTWTEEAPMLGNKLSPAAGVLGSLKTGFTLIAADGATQSGQITGDTEGYDAATNTWKELSADPTARVFSCAGSIGSKLYDAGGYLNNAGAAATVNESFQLLKNKWTKTLAPMPQGTMVGASAVYKGQLYCIGGWATWVGAPINNVQIYQP